MCDDGQCRYRAAQLAHGPRWATYATGHGDPWFGFDAVRIARAETLNALTRDMPVSRLLIPYDGHPSAFTNQLLADELKRRLLSP